MFERIVAAVSVLLVTVSSSFKEEINVQISRKFVSSPGSRAPVHEQDSTETAGMD
jgi:hypothetical protein